MPSVILRPPVRRRGRFRSNANVFRRGVGRRSLDDLARFGACFRWEVLTEIADRRACTPRQVALTFLTRLPGVFAIPKAMTIEHVTENAGAAGWTLTNDEAAAIDSAFPTPTRLQHWMRRATRRGVRTILDAIRPPVPRGSS